MTTLAQFNSVPAEFLQYFIVLLAAIAAIAVPIWLGLRRKSVAIDPQPVEVRKAAKRYNHELITTRFENAENHLRTHDNQIQELWTTMRAEDSALRREMNQALKDIERALGRIEGALKPPT